MELKLTKKPTNVLVVCHGNICRSPLVGIILSNEFKVRTGGFVNPNKPANKKIREYAEHQSLDLSNHRSRLVNPKDYLWADVIVYMDNGNLKRLRETKAPENKLFCLASIVGETRIPDPNYMKRGPELYSLLDFIRDCANKLKEKLINEHLGE